jgi:hypothetical protein
MDEQSGELCVSLEGHTQLFMLLGALRVAIVVLRVYIKKSQFSDSNSEPGFGLCAPKNKEVSGVVLNRRVLI